MTGKDLFASLNFIDDELIEEAANYAPARILPMRAIRRAGALAACVCLIVCLAVLFRSGVFLSGSAAPESMMDVGKEMYQEDACVTEEAVEEETAAEEAAPAEMEEAMEKIEDTAESEMADGAPEAENSTTDSEYVILNQAFPQVQNDWDSWHKDPENGTFILDEELSGTIGQCKLAHMRAQPRFLVAFDLYRDEKKLDSDSAEYRQEVERLEELGYEFRTLAVQNKDKSVKMQMCGLLSEKQLEMFEGSDDYGYFIYFPKNEDRSPLDWENTAEFCGLPTADDKTEE